MTPYAVRFAGYEIASGTLDANLHYQVDHGRLNADHRLVIRQLQLGEQVASAHATKLPLRLAVALLKDRDGVIRLGLPVTGSLSDPQFSLGPLHREGAAARAGEGRHGAVHDARASLRRRCRHEPHRLRARKRDPAARGAGAGRRTGQGARAAPAAATAGARPCSAPAVDQAGARAAAAARTSCLPWRAAGRLAEGAAGRCAGGKGRPRRRPTGPEVLELPAAHYRLLRAAYQKPFGPKAPLPAAAQKVPPFEPAILELQSALLARMAVSDPTSQALAEQRAQAIRAAIIAAGAVAAGRIGTAAPAARPATAGKVIGRARSKIASGLRRSTLLRVVGSRTEEQ